MRKKKILFLIPFLLVAGLLLYCWATILFSDTLATWRHYLGHCFFIPIAILFFKDLAKAVFAFGIYLLLATFNVLALTPTITTAWLNMGGVVTPPVQLLSLGLFLLYFMLNLDTLIDIYLDYKEAKERRANNRLADAAKTGLVK